MRDVGGIISVYAREQVYEQMDRQVMRSNADVSGHVWEVVSRGIYDQVGARVYNQVDGKSGWRRSVTSL